ncbi:hypothetical protein CRG98_014816 [Punica granatum]|uniref:Uncharacterized protein n=1 Tax=Punica granatum TaxID=22663 RepID=A0A2I0K9G8_PUNGR|nr:hypothetical protein CRG98_014816 [Punica granatum]
MAEGSSSRVEDEVTASYELLILVNCLRKLSFFDAVAEGMLHYDDGLELLSHYVASTSARDDQIFVYPYQIKAGLQWPLHDSILEIARYYRIAPTQLTPHALRVLFTFFIYCKPRLTNVGARNNAMYFLEARTNVMGSPIITTDKKSSFVCKKIYFLISRKDWSWRRGPFLDKPSRLLAHEVAEWKKRFPEGFHPLNPTTWVNEANLIRAKLILASRGDVDWVTFSPNQGYLMKESRKRKRQLDDAFDEVEDEDAGFEKTTFFPLAKEPSLQIGDKIVLKRGSVLNFLQTGMSLTRATPEILKSPLNCFDLLSSSMTSMTESGKQIASIQCASSLSTGLRDDVKKLSDMIQSLNKEINEKEREKRAMKQSLD